MPKFGVPNTGWKTKIKYLVLQQIDLQVGFGSSWFAALLSFSDMMLLAKQLVTFSLFEPSNPFES
jgi:hypothetical protein